MHFDDTVSQPKFLVAHIGYSPIDAQLSCHPRLLSETINQGICRCRIGGCGSYPQDRGAAQLTLDRGVVPRQAEAGLSARAPSAGQRQFALASTLGQGHLSLALHTTQSPGPRRQSGLARSAPTTWPVIWRMSAISSPRPSAPGIQDVVFVAMGDSNLAMEAVSRASDRNPLASRLPSRQYRSRGDPRDRRATRFPQHPLRLRQQIRQAYRDAFPTALLSRAPQNRRHHRSRPLLHRRSPRRAPTSPRTLAPTASSKRFLDPPGIKGRYSSLIHFGLLLSALWRFDPEDLASRTLAMRDLCQQPTEANPAFALAAFLAAAVLEGHDKLLFLGTKSLEAATLRVGQLVGTSISKENRGLIPITGAAPHSLAAYLQGAAIVTLTMQGDDDSTSGLPKLDARAKACPSFPST